MSEEHIIRHCSPTLAGLKTGNLFNYTFVDRQEMQQSLRRLNRILCKKGLRIQPLRYRDGRALIYVYRPSHLSRDLEHSVAADLLEKHGYGGKRPSHCVAYLGRRLQAQEDFPHEIGLFLGYPPEDVLGFMQDTKDGCKYVGCWKVYGDVDAACKIFAKYRKCTAVYQRKWADGRSMEQLTVAG